MYRIILGILFILVPLSIKAQNDAEIIINFSGFNLHVGERFEVRVINTLLNREIERKKLSVIPEPDFSITFTGLEIGRDYQLEFYADHNMNGLYDPPPQDHSYIVYIKDAQSVNEINFAHNGNFEVLDWKYEAIILFEEMDGHIGDLFEVMLRDAETSHIIGKKKLEPIPSGSFSITIPGIDPNTSYLLEFYADYSTNKLYDAPPVDHAWKKEFISSDGDTYVEFIHNSDLVDINWEYLYTLSLYSMGDHEGQELYLRLIDTGSGNRSSATYNTAITKDDFAMVVPGISPNTDYLVEFFVDMNKNGIYDSPPIDHAWRLSFNSTAGDYDQDFSHTNAFTDIDWGEVTDVETKPMTVPHEVMLNQNYPNPFNPSTKIRFGIPLEGNVDLAVYNILGQKMTSLINDVINAGYYEVDFNASGLSSGIYFYVLRTNKKTITRKMILVK